MSETEIDTLIVGGGQAGLAISAHLCHRGVANLVLERDRIAEAWRTSRWDGLVANGPAWHDRFPDREFDDTAGEDFAPKDSVARYFEDYVRQHALPVTTGVAVDRVAPASGQGFRVETTAGSYLARNVVAATGPFQVPVIPPLVPANAAVCQLHSQSYRNPDQLPPGAVLVVGAGSSGAQIADELRRAGRAVYLSVGPHERPPRRYRGHDYCYWLGVLGKWDMPTPPAGREHVTISVSGALGGETVDFRRMADRGVTLLGMAEAYADGVLSFQKDLAGHIADGDAYYLSLLEEIDAYIAAEGLDLPEEPSAKVIGPDPDCLRTPVTRLDLAANEISTILWATGYKQDFGWLQVGAFAENGAPAHRRGVSAVPGIYFLGLPWLSMRGSSFIWGVYKDAAYLADHIAARQRP